MPELFTSSRVYLLVGYIGFYSGYYKSIVFWYVTPCSMGVASLPNAGKQLYIYITNSMV
jgi:hypothetical protein